MESAIYTGSVRHRRFSPNRHEFDFPLFMVWLDVDKLDELMRISPFASRNRFNWVSYDDRDHFGDPSLTLRERLNADALADGIDVSKCQIFMLTHLRYLGYNFNPVSFFYCFDSSGRIEAVLAEVNNTFGETKNYWLDSSSVLASGEDLRRHRVHKEMHVSPFMSMDMDYTFAFSKPGDELLIKMQTIDKSGAFFDATLEMDRREWSSASLHRTLLEFPFMTAKVVLAIHWQALRLLLKKIPVFSHPKGLGWKV